jgi:hypothetical protein
MFRHGTTDKLCDRGGSLQPRNQLMAATVVLISANDQQQDGGPLSELQQKR